MHVILHAGVHATDDDRFLKCMLRNVEALRKRGVSVPGPSRYRNLLREAIHRLGEGNMAADARETLIESIVQEDPETIDRLVLSNENFFSVPKIAISNGYIYPMASGRLEKLSQLFDGDEIELFIGIRNPATWLPELFKRSPHPNFDLMLGGSGPFDLRWSEFVARLRREAPQVAITVWCNEDTPLIWGQIIREAGGIDMTQKIVGAFDILSEIMSKEGMQRFRAYLAEHPVMTEIQKRRVMAAFLDKFALDDEIEESIDIPGWTDELIDTLTDIYDEDVYAIGRMPGVNLITP